MTEDERLREMLGKAGPLPEVLPPGVRARLEKAALKPPAPAWLPAGIGIAAGVLVALVLHRPAAPAPLESPAVSGSWQDLRLADGTAVALAPESRLVLLDGRAARLEEGTAWFAVTPGKGGFRVSVPGGRVEVLGTQFGISVETKGEWKMRNPWMIGGAAAVVAVGVTSGIVHYVDAAGAPTEVKADQRLEVDREGGKRLVALREREEALRKQEQDLAAREKSLQERSAALERKPVAEAPASPVAEAKPAKKKGGFAKMMEMTAKMMDSPAAQQQVRMGLKMQLGEIYGDLLKGWDLDEAGREAVEGILIDRVLAQMKIGMLILDEDVGVDEILSKQDELLAKSQGDLAGRLDRDRLAALEAYDKTLGERMAGKQVDLDLEPLGLDPALRAHVRAIILEEQKNMPEEMRMGMGQEDQFQRKTAEDIRRARAMFSADARDLAETARTGIQATNEKVRTRLQPLLTADQLAAYRKQQDAQLQMIEMGLKMMESMGGP